MKESRHITRTKISLILVVLAASYLYLSSPSEVVVRESGEVFGLINKFRATLQGKRFWEKQLIEVDRELKWELGEPQRDAELQRELQNFEDSDREFEKELQQLYQDYPDMRPSAAEQQAETLREKADAIEQAALESELKKMSCQRIAELRRIKKMAEVKVN